MDMLRWIVYGVPLLLILLLIDGEGGPELLPGVLVLMVVALVAYVVYLTGVTVRRGRTLWGETAALGVTLALLNVGLGLTLLVPALIWGGIRGLRHLYRRSRGVHVVTS